LCDQLSWCLWLRSNTIFFLNIKLIPYTNNFLYVCCFTLLEIHELLKTFLRRTPFVIHNLSRDTDTLLLLLLLNLIWLLCLVILGAYVICWKRELHSRLRLSDGIPTDTPFELLWLWFLGYFFKTLTFFWMAIRLECLAAGWINRSEITLIVGWNFIFISPCWYCWFLIYIWRSFQRAFLSRTWECILLLFSFIFYFSKNLCFILFIWYIF